MKMHLNKLVRAGLSLGSLVAIALLGSFTGTSRAASADPSVGSSFTWDFSSSGSGQRGIAVITFSNDNTFHGFQMWASLPPSTNVLNNRGGDDGGRGGDGTGSTSGSASNFVFGFSPINGFWSFNQKKQIVGFFSVALNVTSEVTNYQSGVAIEEITNSQTFDTTEIFVSFAQGQAQVVTNYTWANPPGFVETYTIDNPFFTTSIGSAEETNSISFTGTSSFARHLTLVCSTTFGKVTYAGVPSPIAADLTGAWVGTKREGGQLFNEFFNLTSFAAAGNPFPDDLPDITSFPNIYFTTNGVGPGYSYVGIAMLCHGEIGFNFNEAGNANGGQRASIGPAKVKKNSVTGKTKGVEEPIVPISFDASLF